LRWAFSVSPPSPSKRLPSASGRFISWLEIKNSASQRGAYAWWVSGENQKARLPVPYEPAVTDVRYEFYHPERKEWKLLTASTIVLVPTRREITVFNNGTRIGNIKKHKIFSPFPWPYGDAFPPGRDLFLWAGTFFRKVLRMIRECPSRSGTSFSSHSPDRPRIIHSRSVPMFSIYGG
jgi:hypothetical protein